MRPSVIFHSDTLITRMTSVQALWYTAPNQAEIRSHQLASIDPGDCQVKTMFSAFSRGTEALVATGRVAIEDYDRMRAPFMGGDFPFPVKYGYANVGLVEVGPDALLGQTVFSLSPHQTTLHLPQSALVPIGNIAPKRALLAANMETALNAVWTAAPCPADRIAVVGGGVIGLLVGYLCAKLPGAEVTLVDINPLRQYEAHKLGMAFASPQDAPQGCDLVVHATASAGGLNTAIGLAGEEATVLELSWFGAGQVPVTLGGAFHSRQLKLMASQVGHIAASHRPRWDYARRLNAAMRLLDDPALDVLIERPIAFQHVCRYLLRIFDPHAGVLCQPISYDA